MQRTEKFVSTSQGRICLSDIGEGFPIVMLHGQGACKEVFASQLQSPLPEIHRLVAIDMPGCGKSGRAKEPEAAYTIPGLATLMHEVLDTLQVTRAMVLGWSLGGHVAIEMLHQQHQRVAGLMLSGTPPIHHGTLSMLWGFHARMDMAMAVKPDISRQTAERFARLCYGDLATSEMVDWLMQSDGRMRAISARSLVHGGGADQRRTVENSPVPLAIVNGSEDPIVRVGYINSVRYANLWEGHCHIIKGNGHVPFLSAPNRFNNLIHQFAMDVKVRPTTMLEPLRSPLSA